VRIALSIPYAPRALSPRAHEGSRTLMRIRKGVREVRRFMNTLDQKLRSLHASTAATALDDLEDRVWGRVREARANAVLERKWRTAQLAAASFALVTGVAFGGVEAAALVRTQQPSVSLTASGLAPSELLEGRE
jgi:hypothetical protein